MAKRIIAALLFLFVAIPAVWSFFVEPAMLKIRHENFTWKSEPLKIALFADLHAGSPHIDLNYIKRIVESINAESPDIILIAGDLAINGVVGGHPLPMGDVVKKFASLKTKYGIYAVLGNHDWWNDAEAIRKSLEANGIHVLENESVLLPFGENSKVNLIAVGDDFTQHADLKKSFANVQNEFPKMVFTHDPGILLDNQEPFDLALAGHMHGGQINVPLFGALLTPGRAPKSWANGWSDTGHGKLFVTKGIGTSILPLRFNAPPEVVMIKISSHN